jgi:lysostaphin
MTERTYPARLALFFASSFIALAPLSAQANMSVSTKTPRQGDTIEVSLTSPAPNGESRLSDSRSSNPAELPSITFNGNQYKAFPTRTFSEKVVSEKDISDKAVPDKGLDAKSESSGGVTGGIASSRDDRSRPEFKALFAVPADLEPGKYTLKSGSDTVTLTVRAGLFPLQHIRLAPSKDNFDTAPGEEEAVERAKSTVSSTRYWHGPFTPPSYARTSTGFGLKRMVNGRLLKDYFHSGLDFAGALGSPILATSSGKVVLVGRGFKLHGNTVAIDHGQGVVSFYIHMKTIKVAEGDEVKAGEPIGTVGQTGRATGPHLHFSIYVNKVAANPSNWFTTTF